MICPMCGCWVDECEPYCPDCGYDMNCIDDDEGF